MKITFISVLTLVSILSCSKEKVSDQIIKEKVSEPTIVEEQNGYTNGSRQGEIRMRTFYDQGASFGCTGNRGNCFPDVVVTPSIAGDLDDIFDVIKTKDDAKILTTFINHRNLLLSVIEEGLFMDVINDKYLVRYYPGESKTTRIMAFINPSTNKIIYVVPFK